MKIAFVCEGDVNDNKYWSGTVNYIFNKISQLGHECEQLGPYHPFPGIKLKLLKKYFVIIRKKRFLIDREPAFRKKVASFYEKKLKNKDYDLIIAPEASVILSELTTSIPIVYISDATFHLLNDYYFSNISNRSLHNGYLTEKRALDNSSLIVFPSNWAANSAINDYGIESKKIKVINFGANMPNLPRIERESNSRNELNFLFLGIDWTRKGGDLVLKVLNHLVSLGKNPILNIVGCEPNLPPDLKFKVNVIGFLNKEIPKDKALVEKLWKETRFLFLPSFKEAYGIVFCEACAYGVPSLALNTGGVGSIIEHNNNGLLFDSKLPVSEMSTEINKLIDDEVWYNTMSNNARMAYEEKLTWSKWADQLFADIKVLTK